MKLNEQQFAAALNKPLAAGLWIHSDEPLLLIEAQSDAREAAKKQGFDSRTVVNADNQTDWQDVFSNANSLSLFAERTLLDVRLTSAKPPQAAQKAFLQYFQNPNPDTVVVISSPKLDASFTRGKTYKTLEQQLDIATLWPIDSSKLPQWLKQRLKTHQLTIDDDALLQMANNVEGNLLAANQLIMQLALLCESTHISLEVLEEVLFNSARFEVFGTVDKALNGQASDCIRALQGLKNEGLAPANISWIFTREVQKLATIRHKAKSIGPDAALKQAGVWKRQEAAYRRTLKLLKTPALNRCVELCQLIDGQSKGQAEGNAWDSLEELALIISNGLKY